MRADCEEMQNFMNLGIWVIKWQMKFTEDKCAWCESGIVFSYVHVKRQCKKAVRVKKVVGWSFLAQRGIWVLWHIGLWERSQSWAAQKANQVLGITRKEIENKLENTMITPHKSINYWHLLYYEHFWSFHLKGCSETGRHTRRGNRKDQRNFREWEECVRDEWGGRSRLCRPKERWPGGLHDRDLQTCEGHTCLRISCVCLFQFEKEGPLKEARRSTIWHRKRGWLFMQWVADLWNSLPEDLKSLHKVLEEKSTAV